MDRPLAIDKIGFLKIRVHRDHPLFVQNYKTHKEKDFIASKNALKKYLASKFFVRLLERNFFQHNWRNVAYLLSVLIYLPEYNNQLIWKIGIELVKNTSLKDYQKEIFSEMINSICTPYQYQMSLIQLLERIKNSCTKNEKYVKLLKNHYSAMVTIFSKKKSYLNTNTYANFILGSIEQIIYKSNSHCNVDSSLNDSPLNVSANNESFVQNNKIKKRLAYEDKTVNNSSSQQNTILKKRCIEHLGSVIENSYWPSAIHKLVDVVDFNDKIKYLDLYIEKHPYDSLTLEFYIKMLQKNFSNEFSLKIELLLSKLSNLYVESNLIIYLIQIYESSKRYFEAISVSLNRLSIYGCQYDIAYLEKLHNILENSHLTFNSTDNNKTANLWFYERDLWNYYENHKDNKDLNPADSTISKDSLIDQSFNEYSIKTDPVTTMRRSIAKYLDKILLRCDTF